MQLVLIDILSEKRSHFYPLVLGRPIWELRCGMRSLEEQLVDRIKPDEVAYFVPEYMADYYKTRTDRPVNDLSALTGKGLVLVDPRLKADGLDVPTDGESQVGLGEQGQMLYARITEEDSKGLSTDSIEAFMAAAKDSLPSVACKMPTWEYTWDLILANPGQLTADFEAAGRSGIEGATEEPLAVRGNRKDVYVAPTAKLHPMVVIDTENGPVYIDEGVEVHPFSRIEGPCYIGKNSILLGAKCREGNSIGPTCRIGGEVEESIVHGYSNKYHDGFLGHSYVGEWVNLGALTTNSDLKNDYSSVSVMLDGRRSIDTGSTKVGSLIGDHTKTSIGTLLNTGSYVGAMAIIMATGKPLPKHIPSFAWFIEGIVTKGFGRSSLYKTAKKAMGRRKCEWSDQAQAMWDAVFEMTSPARDRAIKKGRKKLLA
ncbi:MAG: putative sugar nucleotidyl transferase [Sedimentisphaerales bacterium]|jgi:UDP-N-acetylglucosamine diphosphorylase/glucosamine-1-phosphate N-acetyltransferase